MRKNQIIEKLQKQFAKTYRSPTYHIWGKKTNQKKTKKKQTC